MFKRIQLAALMLLALIALALPCVAATDWLMDAWRVEDGLPDNVINAITQTPDGYIWLGTQGGLARFDGVRFKLVEDPAFKIERVYQLYVDRAGRLWVVSEQGDVAVIHEGKVKTFGPADGIPPNGLQTPVEDGQGNMWFSARADEGCFQFDGKHFLNICPTNAPTGQFQFLAFDGDGTLYGVREGELWKVAPQAPAPVPARTGSGTQPATLVCPSRHGGFWLISSNDCFLVRKGQWERIADVPSDINWSVAVSVNYEDALGRLWVSGFQRPRPMSIATNGMVEFPTFNSRPSVNCRVLFEDREGNRWWGTGNDGLRRFHPRRLELVSDDENLPSNPVLAVAADPHEGLWAIIGRGLVRIIGTEPRRQPERVPRAKSLWVDRDRTVWVGGEGTGLFCVASNRFDHFLEHTTDQPATPPISALFRDAQNQLLAGTSEGLFQLAGNTLRREAIGGDAESRRLDIRAFAQDSHGRVFAALRNGGLMQREGERWRPVTNHLAGDDLAALYCDADDNLWLGVTGHGLARLRGGKVFSFQPTRVRLPRNISGILEDTAGRLWLASSEGIFAVARKELNAVAEGRSEDAAVRQFDRSNGMLSSQCASGQQPVMTRSRDGKLWFATARGLYAIDPASLTREELCPPPVVEEVLVDGQSVWQRPLNSRRPPPVVLRVAPDNARIEFHYTSLSMSAPSHIRFRYQFAGLNPDWVEADADRYTYYTRVPPGDYQFKVMACNDAGLWSEASATVAVTVLQPWWRTSWFGGLAATGGGMLLWGVYQGRTRRLARERSLQLQFSRTLMESQEQERRRISAELHDSLGQSLLVVKNYAVMALKPTTPPEKMREQLTEISVAASASIEEVRAIARALRPYQLDRFGLTKTLEDTAELVAKTGGLQIETEIDDLDNAFSPDAEISIYRMVQEWLNNVTKHAQASLARLVVRREPGCARLILEDNGVGFDYAALVNRAAGQAGFGLANLRERVRLLEGSLRIETAPGKGTRLHVEIPCKK